MTNAKELDDITKNNHILPMGDKQMTIDWKPMQKWLKLTAATLTAGIILFAGYWAGEYVTNHRYAYTSYMSADAIGVAKDQLALCRGENKHCNTEQLQKAVNRLAGEAWVKGEGKP